MVLEILCRKSSTGVLWHEAFESTLNDADDEAFLYAWIVALAHEYGRYGYRRNTALLHQQGWPNNYGLVKFTGEETTVKTSTWERGIGIGIGAFAVLAVVAPPLWAFDTFEHRHLGNVAYEQAKRAVKGNLPQQVMDDLRKFEKELEVRETPCIPSSQIKPSQCMAIKALRRIPVRFGDFAALAGDHAGTPAEVYEMVQNFVQVGKHSEEVTRVLATRRQWERACAQMRRYYSDGGELDGVHCVKDGGPKSQSADAVLPLTGYSPQRDEWSEIEGLPGFFDLVSSNQSHFPTHSWREYAVRHHAALQAAKSYKDKKADKEGCRDFITILRLKKVEYNYGEDAPLCYLRRALVYEGYAQHFLHDSFASGHIGTEFGNCVISAFGCAPDKQVVNHIHNELNRLGLKVTFNTAGQKFLMDAQKRFRLIKDLKLEDFSQGWLATGDDFLMVPEAGFHREIVSLIATASLIEVLEAMGEEGGSEQSLHDVCEKWVDVFPEATDTQLMRVIHRPTLCRTTGRGPDEEFSSDTAVDLAIFQADRPRLWPSPLWPDAGYTHRLLGRTMDDRVRIVPLEGWKFMVSWGQTWGRFDQLDANGNRVTPKNGENSGTFEVGYVRTTNPWFPNYLGFGAAVTSEVRTVIYPLSLGYWGGTDSRTIFWGLRMNAGLRIDEPLIESNPGQTQESSMELAFPLDIGFKVYKGVSLYIRPELLVINLPEFAWNGAKTAVVEHIFNGQGRLTFGLVLDFGEVF